MNEPLWQATGNPSAMLDELRHKVSNRKLRWLAVACVRRYPSARFTKFHWDTVEEIEGEIDYDGLVPVSQPWMGSLLESLLAVNAFYAARGVLGQTARTTEANEAKRETISKAQCELLRDIFGNPFRPVVFSPEWRTDTARALASQMYASSDFSAMPILADALQDAGCDSDDVLSHCREPGEHVRGCWVVDLVLGKE